MDEYKGIRSLGKTKNVTLNAIKNVWPGDHDGSAPSSRKLMEFAVKRMRT
ncbi:Shufflon-specific DNA recombinase [Pseudomonas chlororaphis subsp. piscium]|nr:Shufflon-specific DNA recombinase [Pseudomonas chlororaphis subsp. piscium]AZC43023.1 Shufflon-specific DNA recombinase [Pseudomonas chlororaphis subsp. piscium]